MTSPGRTPKGQGKRTAAAMSPSSVPENRVTAQQNIVPADKSGADNRFRQMVSLCSQIAQEGESYRLPADGARPKDPYLATVVHAAEAFLESVNKSRDTKQR